MSYSMELTNLEATVAAQPSFASQNNSTRMHGAEASSVAGKIVK